MRSLWFILLAVLVGVFLAGAGARHVSPPPPNLIITMDPLVEVASPSRGGFPALHKDVSGTIWLSYSITVDSSDVAQKMAVLYLKPGSSIWEPSGQSVHLLNAHQRDSGDIAFFERGRKSGPSSANISAHVLNNSSGTWTPQAARIDLIGTLRNWPYIYFNNGIINADGVYYAPYYAGFTNDSGSSNRSDLAISKDGINWKTQGTIFRPYKSSRGMVSFSETSVVYLGGGAMYAVARRGDSGRLPLAYATSSDYGKTWSGPSDVMFDNSPFDQTAQPKLIPLGNSYFALLTGRPDNYIVVGISDGNTISWLKKQMVYSNYHTADRYSGSSGYMGGVVTESGANFAKLLLSFDSCAPDWGCANRQGGSYTTTSTPRIYTRTVTVNW